MRLLNLVLAAALLIGAFFAPFFIGVCYQLQVFYCGHLAISVRYIVPLAEYGKIDEYSLSLMALYVWLPIGVAMRLIYTAFED